MCVFSGATDAGGFSGGHYPELNQAIPFGNSIVNLAKSNTIEDRLQVPTGVAAGAYVVRLDTRSLSCDCVLTVPLLASSVWQVQWRWDCEGTSQIWTTCSDVTIE